MHERHVADDFPSLPPGWRRLSAADAAGLVQELNSEISSGHTLAGIAVTALAARDAILCRHSDSPLRFTIVHLTWSGSRETSPHWPSIEFAGTFAGFLSSEHGLLGQQNI